jgi:hypothetical protein
MPPNHPAQKPPSVSVQEEVPYHQAKLSPYSIERAKVSDLSNKGKSEIGMERSPSLSSRNLPLLPTTSRPRTAPIGSNSPHQSSSSRNISMSNQIVNNPAGISGNPISNSSLSSYPSNYGSYGGGYSNYGTPMLGGMGMMGMGYPGMYGMGMNPFMGPMSLLANVNYAILGVGQFISMLGMSSTMFVSMFHSLVQSFKLFEASVRQSTLRRWFQRKCKKSSVFRFVVVISAMAIIGTASKLVKDVIKSYIQQWGGRHSLLTNVASSVANS